MERVKHILEKITTKIRYSRCYTFNECSGNAVFGMCNCSDMECPYNVNKIKSRRVQESEEP